jgi:hypothetical protein
MCPWIDYPDEGDSEVAVIVELLFEVAGAVVFGKDLDGEKRRCPKDLLVRLGHVQQQADDPGALATLTEAAALARRSGATAIVARAALATDRGFLRAGPVAPAQVAIIESALEVAGADAGADPGTRARLLALLADATIIKLSAKSTLASSRPKTVCGARAFFLRIWSSQPSYFQELVPM